MMVWIINIEELTQRVTEKSQRNTEKKACLAIFA